MKRLRTTRLPLAVLCLAGAAGGLTAQGLAGDTNRHATAVRTNLSVTAVSLSENTENQTAVVFEVTVTNGGPHAAEAVLLEMVVDEAALRLFGGRRIEPSRPMRCVIESLVCDIGELAASDSLTIAVSGTLPASPPFSSFGMEIRVSSKTIDSMPFDNRYYSSTFLKRDTARMAGT